MPQTLLMESMYLPDFRNYSQNIASGKKTCQGTASYLSRIGLASLSRFREILSKVFLSFQCETFIALHVTEICFSVEPLT